MKSSIADIWPRVLKGDEKAKKELYDAFSIAMFNVCRSYFPDVSDAEDVFQDGFIKVFENIHCVKSAETLPGWIKRVFTNTCIDALRRKRFTFSVLDINSASLTSLNSVEEQLAHEEILKLVHKLPIRSRLVFIMYVVEGYTHKEIAELIGITEGTSKSQLFEAKLKLKKQIDLIESSDLAIKWKTYEIAI